MTTYVDRIRVHGVSISIEDVRLAAWATFLLRYTNLKFASARYLHVFSLATRRMIDLSRIESANE